MMIVKSCIICEQDRYEGELTSALCEPHYQKFRLSNKTFEEFIKSTMIKFSHRIEKGEYKGFCYAGECANLAIKEVKYMDKTVLVCGTHFNNQSWKTFGEMCQKAGIPEWNAKKLNRRINYGID